MKKVGENLIFLPNTGPKNFYPANQEEIEGVLVEQAGGDFPKTSSLGRVTNRHSIDGMVPIKNKPKR